MMKRETPYILHPMHLTHRLIGQPLAKGFRLLIDRWGHKLSSAAGSCNPEGLCTPVEESAVLQESVREARGHQDNKLELWGDAPRYEYSTVPLMRADGLKPVSNPKAGSRGHALLLNDKQVQSASVNPPPAL